jgi:hypothetical protein
MRWIFIIVVTLTISGTVPEKPKTQTIIVCPTTNTADCYKLKQVVSNE